MCQEEVPLLSCLPRKSNNCQNSLNYGQRTTAGIVSKDLGMCSTLLVDNSPLETGGLSDERPPTNKKINCQNSLNYGQRMTAGIVSKD